MYVQYGFSEGEVHLTHDIEEDMLSISACGVEEWLTGEEVDQFMKAVEEIRIRRIKRDDSLVNKINVQPYTLQPCITVNNA